MVKCSVLDVWHGMTLFKKCLCYVHSLSTCGQQTWVFLQQAAYRSENAGNKLHKEALYRLCVSIVLSLALVLSSTTRLQKHENNIKNRQNVSLESCALHVAQIFDQLV